MCVGVLDRPFKEIVEHEIFVNCIYLMGTIPPFLTKQTIEEASEEERRLSVVVDVSCDYTNPANPLPIYHDASTFVNPALRVPLNNATSRSSLPLDVVSIDHLPSLVPRESSIDFSNDLLASILSLAQWERCSSQQQQQQGAAEEALPSSASTAPVWDRASQLFEQKLHEMQDLHDGHQ